MVSKMSVLKATFTATSIISLLATFYIVYLLFSSYSVVYGIDASVLKFDPAGSTNSANVTILIKNKSAFNLRLVYVKIVIYVEDATKLENDITFYDNPIGLKPLSNTSVSLLAYAQPGTLISPSLKYGYAIIYLRIYDVPLINVAPLTRTGAFYVS